MALASTHGDTMNAITTRQIEALMTEAAAAGDMAQVAMCRRALDGSARARKGCAKAIKANA